MCCTTACAWASGMMSSCVPWLNHNCLPRSASAGAVSGTTCGNRRPCQTMPACISAGRVSSSDKAIIPPWLKPPTTTRSGAMPHCPAAASIDLAAKARLSASCAASMLRSLSGPIEKSNQAYASGPIRKGARRLSRWNRSGICGARPNRSCSLLPTPCSSTSNQGRDMAGAAGRCKKLSGKSNLFVQVVQRRDSSTWAGPHSIPESSVHFVGVACRAFVLSALCLRERFGNGITTLADRHAPGPAMPWWHCVAFCLAAAAAWRCTRVWWRGAVLLLAAVLPGLDDDHAFLRDACVAQGQQALFHIFGQRGGGHVKAQMYCAGHLVDVLTARALCAHGGDFHLLHRHLQGQRGHGGSACHRGGGCRPLRRQAAALAPSRRGPAGSRAPQTRIPRR